MDMTDENLRAVAEALTDLEPGEAADPTVDAFVCLSRAMFALACGDKNEAERLLSMSKAAAAAARVAG